MFSHAVVNPPTAGLLVLPIATVRQHCRVSGTYDDALLTLYCQAATAMVEAYTARSLLSQTLRMTSTSTLPPASVPLSLGPMMVYPMWYGSILTTPYRRIDLLRSPVNAVVSINVTDSSDGSTQLLTANTDYLLDRDTDPAAISFLSSFTLLPQYRLNIVYTAGFPAGRIPTPLINAVLLLTGYLYQKRGDDDLSEMPAMVRHLADPYRLSYFGSITPDGR